MDAVGNAVKAIMCKRAAKYSLLSYMFRQMFAKSKNILFLEINQTFQIVLISPTNLPYIFGRVEKIYLLYLTFLFYFHNIFGRNYYYQLQIRFTKLFSQIQINLVLLYYYDLCLL